MLTSNEIKKQIENGNIKISNMRADALRKPNSCNVSIGDTLYVYDYQIVDTKKKYEYAKEIESGYLKKLRQVKIPKSGFLLEPRKVYIAKTNERIKTNGYIPVLNGKYSLSSLGLSIELNNGFGSSNYDGYFIVSIVATNPIIIYPEIEIGNLTFFKSLTSKSDETGMLSGDEIKRRMKTGDIIITPQDNIVINPNSVNLTLNKKIYYYKNYVLDIKKDNPLESIEIGEDGIVLYPDRIYIARTNEWTETNNLVPMISGRSSLGRLGFHAHCSASLGSIGYKGYWHTTIRVMHPIKIYKDMKCCQIYYLTKEGEVTNSEDL